MYNIILGVDSVANIASLKTSGIGEDQQTSRVEFDQQAISVSLLNNSDLGLTLDNNGLTTVYDLAVNNFVKCPGLIVPSPNGTKYRVTVDDNGNLISVAV